MAEPVAIAVGYALVAVVWIIGSGLVVGTLPDIDVVPVEIVKGLGFVVVTAGALYLMLRRRDRVLVAANAELLEADAQLHLLRQALEASPAGIAILGDLEHGFPVEYVNSSIARISGVPAEQVIGVSAATLANEEIPGQWSRIVAAMETGEPFELEVDVTRPDGAVVPVDVIGNVVPATDGRGHTVLVATDISEQRRVALERATLTRAIDQAQEGVVITDLDATIEYVNPAFERTSGYPREHLIGANPRILHSGVQSKAFYRQLWDQLNSGQPWHGIIVNRRRDGVLYEEDVTISPVRDEAGAVVAYVGVQRDLTSERALEQGLQDEIRDRALVRELASGIRHGATAEETAASLVDAVMMLGDVDAAIVYHLRRLGGDVVALAGATPPSMPLEIGASAPPAFAAFVRERIEEAATGSMRIDLARFDPRLELGGAQGYAAVASAAEVDGEPVALVVALGRPSDVTTWITRREQAVAEMATHMAPIIGPQLTLRDDVATLTAVIRDVLDHESFWPVFQPIVDLESGRIVGYETLTRFADDTRPDLRFAEAAAVRLGGELQLASVRKALATTGQLLPDTWLSFNASPTFILHGHLADEVAGADRPLVLEVTEHAAIEDYAAIRDALEALGPSVRIAVDDAGAGYASLRHVLELRPAYVKLDIGLIRGIENDAARQALVAGMVHFARQTETELIAEGIETEAEAAVVRRLGVQLGQGYLFGRPARLDSGGSPVPG